MSNRSENIRFNVYLNDKQAGNTMGGLYKQSRKLRSELNKLKIGSQAWINKMRELQKVERQLKNVRSEIKNTNSRLSKMAGAFNKYFGIITAVVAGIAGVFYSLKKSTQVLVDFEKTLANVLTLLTEADKLKYRDYLKQGSIDIIKKYGFAIEDTNKALFDSISAGVEAGKSVEFLNTASVLAIGGVTKLSVSVDGLTTVINAYKLQTADANEVAAAFFSAQKEGKTTVELLASGIGKAAPLANSLGISYQELLSATAALTKGGIDTESAFTYLRGTFSSLIKPSKNLVKLFKNEFGYTINATAVKSRGFTQVLTDLSVLLKKYPNQLQSSVENIRALTAVTALSGEGLEDYKNILEKVNTDIGSHNSLTKAFAEQETTMSQALAKAKGNLTAMTIALSESFKPTIIAVSRFAATFSHTLLKMATWMKKHSVAVKNFAKALGVVITSLITYKTVVAIANAKTTIAIRLTGLWQNIALRTAIAYNKLTGNITRAAAAQRVLNTTVKANPIGLILSLLSMAVTAYMVFSDKVKEATAEQKRLNDELERQKELMKDNSSIEDRAKTIDLMTEGQLKAFKIDLEQQLEQIEKVNQQKLVAAKKYQEEVDKLNKQYANEDAETRKALLNNKAVTAARDKALAELTRLTKFEQQLNAQRLNELKTITEEKLKAFAGGDGDNGGGDQSSPTDEELKKLEKLNEKIKELNRENELAKMESNDREIAIIKDKYAKLIDEAKGYDDKIKRLEELRDAEIKRKQAELEKKALEAKKAALLKIETAIGKSQFNELNNEQMMLEAKLRIAKKGSDEYIAIQQKLADVQLRIRKAAENNEVEAVKQKFALLKKLAEDNGIDTTKFTDQLAAEIQAIHQRYNAQEVAENKQKNYQKLMDDFEVAQKTLSVTSQMLGNISGLFEEHSAEHKALAVFQATIDAAQATLAAFKSGSEIHLAVGIAAAAAAAAFGAAKVMDIVNTDYDKPNSNYNASISTPAYGKGGVAAGASHSQGGIALMDTKSGKKVGEMEGGEPYMILSRETYKNNKKLIDALLDASINRNGAPVEYMKPGYFPHPDVTAAMANLKTVKYASGTVTNINNVFKNQSNTQNINKDDQVVILLSDMLNEFKKFKYVKAVVDTDGVIKIKEAINEFEEYDALAGN